MDDFKTLYKKITDTELLEILQNQDDYQPQALQAAREELVARDLTEAEINKAMAPIVAKNAQKEQQKKKTKAIEQKVKTIGVFFYDLVNPIEEEKASPRENRIIRAITVTYGFSLIYELVVSRWIIKWAVTGFQETPVLSSLLLMPFLILSIGVFYFWKRKSIGWILLTSFVTMALCGKSIQLLSLISFYRQRPQHYSFLLPEFSPTAEIFQLLLLAGTLFVLCKPNIRNIYSINIQTMVISIVSSAIFPGLLLLI